MTYLVHWAYFTDDGDLLNWPCQCYVASSPDAPYPATVIPGTVPVRVKVDEILSSERDLIEAWEASSYDDLPALSGSFVSEEV